jgi:hypothetical protein
MNGGSSATNGISLLRAEHERMRNDLNHAATAEEQRLAVALIAAHVQIERLLLHPRLHPATALPAAETDCEHIIEMAQRLWCPGQARPDQALAVEELRTAIDSHIQEVEACLRERGAALTAVNASALAVEIERLRPFAMTETEVVLRSGLGAGMTQVWIG